MATPDSSTEPTVLVPCESLITLAQVVYALHAFSALSGLARSVLVLTAFLAWIDSHFGSQIHSFWYVLAWLLAGGVDDPIRGEADAAVARQAPVPLAHRTDSAANGVA